MLDRSWFRRSERRGAASCRGQRHKPVQLPANMQEGIRAARERGTTTSWIPGAHSILQENGCRRTLSATSNADISQINCAPHSLAHPFTASPAFHDLHENLCRALALLARDVEVSHRPHRARAEGEDEHAALLGACNHRGGIRRVGSESEDENVGL